MTMAGGEHNSQRNMNSDLNARERWFVEYYVAGDRTTIDNAFQSAIRAGYSRSTAETWASSWVKDPTSDAKVQNPKPWVWRAIRERRESIISPTAMTAEEVLLETSKLARHSPSKYTRVTDDGDIYINFSEMTPDDWSAIGSIEVEDYAEGRGEDARNVKRIKVKPWDKKGALDLMSRMLGMQKNILSNDPDNPMPGTTINMGETYDLSKLTLDEVDTLHALLEKAKA